MCMAEPVVPLIDQRFETQKARVVNRSHELPGRILGAVRVIPR